MRNSHPGNLRRTCVDTALRSSCATTDEPRAVGAQDWDRDHVSIPVRDGRARCAGGRVARGAVAGEGKGGVR